jgi:hypothetical protein|tara:strand:+ start:156 stop:395 length:240 start_codon:yes stop_codon:yes gene_type:complete
VFTVLSKLKYQIAKEITKVEKQWDDNPSNDYYFAEISGLRRALQFVELAESKELTALDRWAEQQQGEDNAINTRELSRG